MKFASFNSAKAWKQKIHDIPYGIAEDAWNISSFTVKSGMVDLKPTTYSFKYRNIMHVLQFLLGHEPFADNLSYSPIRLYSDDEKTVRVYNEMHTADWWWDTQKCLPPDATVIPIILASDKTTLTYHHGDQQAWPVYVTIGNLDKQTRRAQNRPAVILLGCIPVLKDHGHHESTAEIYHTVLEAMLKRMSSFRILPHPL